MTTDDNAHDGAENSGSTSEEADNNDAAPAPRESKNARSATLRPPKIDWPRIVGEPTVVLTLLTALLAVMYFGYVADPEKNLHDFPVLLVNSDVGDVGSDPDAPEPVNYGNQVADALVEGVPADKVDLQVVGPNEADRLLRDAQAYGAIIIPGDFSKRLGILGAGSVVPGEIEKPIITLQTSPRTGPFTVGILQQLGEQALDEVNQQVGAQLTGTVAEQLGPDGPEISGAAALTIESPVEIVETQYRPLSDGTGQGLTAFFYSLLLLLVGMIGAMIIHTLVDGRLGYMPTEYGPFYVHRPAHPVSRIRTLLIKSVAMTVVAVVVAGVYMLVAHLLGMPLDRPLALYLFSVLAIVAVGWTALAILAVLGTAGILVNLILFVILGLPSSGGTIPIEAVPSYMTWLAEFEPMRQVFLGVRSILYFDASGPAGLAQGSWMCLLGIAIALVLGLGGTQFYDRKGFLRFPAHQA